MNTWETLYFFDKNGKYYNFEYDTTSNMWVGNIYLPQVSTGLFEVGQLFILEKFIDSNSNTNKFGYPQSKVSDNLNWLVEWETVDPIDIFLFKFNKNFVSGFNSALEEETIGPPIERYNEILIPLDYDPNRQINSDNLVITNKIRSEAVEINFTINSDEENTFKRNLIIRDVYSNTIIAKFTIYAETIGEDERLRTLTENLGYNITYEDSLIFRDTNVYESKPDFIELNTKRKEIMLEGHNIYPYISSYKGLINAIKYFGFNNLEVKEFWKNINPDSANYGKYIQSNAIKILDEGTNYNDLTITLPNKNFRKTNIFSLIYKINKIKSGEYNEENFPIVEEVFDYTLEEVLIKLFGLKRKLEKEFLPLSSYIKDIVGEADFFTGVGIKNTISKNKKLNIEAGIPADFKVFPDECTYIEDLRSFASFCFKEEAVVEQAIIEFCNAYVAPLTLLQTGQNVQRSIPINTNSGVITFTGNVNDFQLILDNASNVSPGEIVCINVRANNFDEIVSMQFSIDYDPVSLQLYSVGNFGLPYLSLANFALPIPGGEGGRPPGSITFSWNVPGEIGETLPDGSPIFQLCFIALANNGQTAVSFTESPTFIEIINESSEELPFNLTSGIISFVSSSLDPVNLIIANASNIRIGETVCLDVTVENFTDLISMQFSINYDTTALQLTSIGGIALPAMSFGLPIPGGAGIIDPGNITASWNIPLSLGESLPDGSVLFNMCFTALSDIGTTSVYFSSTPTPIEIVNASLEFVPFSLTPGIVSFLGVPGSLTPINVSIENETNVGIGELFCLNVNFDNLININRLSFTINYDPTKLIFNSVGNFNLLGLNSNNFNLVSQGVIIMSWFNSIAQTVPNGTALFNICFTSLVDSGSTVISFGNVPTPIIAVTGTSLPDSIQQTARNLILGPYLLGDQLPNTPIGPDFNNPLGRPFGGQNFTIGELADAYLAYFTRYSPNLNMFGEVEDGRTSLYLPDKPNIPIGALIVLENTSFGNLTWNNIDLNWEQVSNANTYHTYDLNPQGSYEGDTFTVSYPDSDLIASYTVLPSDTDDTIVNNLLTQLQNFKISLSEPWVFFEISKVTLDFGGTAIRIFGKNTQNVIVNVDRNIISGAQFRKIDSAGELLYTWDSVQRGNFAEIEWTITKPVNEYSPEYYYKVRGSIGQFSRYPITLPYVGDYDVEMKLIDLYNNVSSIIKRSSICVSAKEVEYSGWYQNRKLNYTWNSEGNWIWRNYGSSWNLPIEPSVTWDEETPSLYESLDRSNAILNTFIPGVSSNFTLLLNFSNDGRVSFPGPYYWNNLEGGNWNDSFHFWWDLTNISADTPAFFEFKEIVPNSFLKITDSKGNIGTHFFDNTILTLSDAAEKLNLSNDPIINKYIYNVVIDSATNERYVQASARYFGTYGDFIDVDIVDINDYRICSSDFSTGSTGDYYIDCKSIIYKKELHNLNNPTWNGAKFINDGVTLNKMTWVMFVYDKCKISGKDKPKWTIKNTSVSNFSPITFESKYLTYLFIEPGKYEIGLELTDSNGNKYNKKRNILIIK